MSEVRKRSRSAITQEVVREPEVSGAAIVEIGRVKVWLEDRGFGFIRDAAGDDVFVHANQLSDEIRKAGPPLLEPGQRVAFGRRQDARGPQAQNVRLCSEPDVISEQQFATEVTALTTATAVPYDLLIQMVRGHGWVV